jgi:hypothetical protein
VLYIHDCKNTDVHHNNLIKNLYDVFFYVFVGPGWRIVPYSSTDKAIEVNRLTFDQNYWDRSIILPMKPLLGFISFFPLLYYVGFRVSFIVFKFDRNPAQEPYDIGL